MLKLGQLLIKAEPSKMLNFHSDQDLALSLFFFSFDKSLISVLFCSFKQNILYIGMAAQVSRHTYICVKSEFTDKLSSTKYVHSTALVNAKHNNADADR